METTIAPVAPVEEPEVLDDVYEREAERLASADWGELLQSYYEIRARKAGPLFQFCTWTGQHGGGCGCLVMVRSGMPAATPALTDRIRRDSRIPDNLEKLRKRWAGMAVSERRSTLRVFASWQRRLDRELGRVPPS